MSMQSNQVSNFPNIDGILEASDGFADAVMKLRQEKHDRIIQAYLDRQAASKAAE